MARRYTFLMATSSLKRRFLAAVLGVLAAAPLADGQNLGKPSRVPAGLAAQLCGITFNEEFDQFRWTPDGSVGWMTTYPYAGESARALPGNGEAEFYSDASVGTHPFSLRDRILTISAFPAQPGSNPYRLPYTSGIMTTFKSFAQAFGYFEIRARLPAGRGLWPAFWLLQDSVTYDSELDIFEVLGKEPTILNATTHTAVNKVWSGYGQKITVPDVSADFHTYGADWEPQTITFYRDGQVIATAPTPATMTKPMYILVNLAVGKPGSWPGAPDAPTIFPAVMQIDYVRAYATRNTMGIAGTAALVPDRCR